MKHAIEPYLDDELCRFVISWHRFEQHLGRLTVIDFDLVGFDDTFEVEILPGRFGYIRWAEELLLKLEDAGLSDSFESQKLNGHMHALRALCGQSFALGDYIEATMAFRPTVYSDEAISSVIDDIESRCSALGLSRDDLAHGHIPEGQVGPQPHDIEEAFCTELSRLTTDIERRFQLKLDFDLRFEFVTEDAYWNYWIDGSGRSYRLRFNRSDRTYGTSEVTHFCLHELIGHCGQASGWYGSSKLSKFARILTVHTCEQVHLEGFAQGLPFLLQDVHSFVELRAVLGRLRQMLLNNAYLSIANGRPIEDVVAMFERSVPVTDRDRLVKNLADQALEPIMRTYMFSYPKGIELIHSLSKQADGVSSFINRSITEPMTASEIQALVD